MQVGIYTRVSTQKQSKNTSGNSQLESIEKYIEDRPEKFKDCEISPYFDIFSASINPKGDEVTRNGLKNLLADAYTKKFKYIICYSHDRFTRNIDEFLIIQQILKKLKIEVIYTKGGENVKSENDSINKLFENLMNNLAALEANVISSRVKLASKYKAKNGIWPGGIPPYGYKLVPILGKKRGTILCVKDVEANIIREIFEMYAKGYSHYDIADYIKKIYHSNNDRTWTHNTIKNIIKNPVYRGQIVWNKKGGRRNPVRRSEEEYERSQIDKKIEIIDKELWEKTVYIRNILKVNSKFISTKFLVSNFAYCGICGSELKAKNHTEQRQHYYCKEHIKIDAKVLDGKVKSEISNILGNILNVDDELNKFYDLYITRLKVIEDESSKHKNRLEEIMSTNKNLEKRFIKKLKELEEEIKDKEDYKDKDYFELIVSLKEQIVNYKFRDKQLKEEVEREEKKDFSRQTVEEFRERVKDNKDDILEIINNIDDRYRTRMLRVLFSKILYKVIVNSEDDIEIIFK